MPILSYKHFTTLPNQFLPQTMFANTIGNIFFGEILLCLTVLFHCYWSRWEPHTVPHPKLPDASVSKVINSHFGLGSNPILFHCSMNLCHHCKSEQISALSLIKWSSSSTNVIKMMILLTNLLLGVPPWQHAVAGQPMIPVHVSWTNPGLLSICQGVAFLGSP